MGRGLTLIIQLHGAVQRNGPVRYASLGTSRHALPANSDPTSLDYTGHQQDNLATNDLGLIYMNARYYLPSLGRFLSPDTLIPDPANPQNFNRYSYAYNNPANLVDPSGHFTEEAIWNYILGACGGDTGCATSTYNGWYSDAAWWDMLLQAQAGDVLLAGTGTTTALFTFLGEGKHSLRGITFSDPFGNPAPSNYFAQVTLAHLAAGYGEFPINDQAGGVNLHYNFYWDGLLRWLKHGSGDIPYVYPQAAGQMAYDVASEGERFFKRTVGFIVQGGAVVISTAVGVPGWLTGFADALSEATNFSIGGYWLDVSGALDNDVRLRVGQHTLVLSVSYNNSGEIATLSLRRAWYSSLYSSTGAPHTYYVR